MNQGERKGILYQTLKPKPISTRKKRHGLWITTFDLDTYTVCKRVTPTRSRETLRYQSTFLEFMIF